jgi:hypothetical protein
MRYFSQLQYLKKMEFIYDNIPRFMEAEARVRRILEARGYIVLRTWGEFNKADLLLGREVDGRATLVGLAEVKSREYAGNLPLTLEYIRKSGGYLVSYHKLDHASKLSAIHQVPFFLIVNLMLSRQLLFFQLTNSEGKFVAEFETKTTQTMKSANGGIANRLNAFLRAEGEFFSASKY